MGISTIHGLQRYLKRYLGFTGRTITSVIFALGYPPQRSAWKDFKELSRLLADCSKHGADAGFTGFSYYTDTVDFFIKHRQDIIKHMEHNAEQAGVDVITYVLNFTQYRNNKFALTPSEIDKALWDITKIHSELTDLYNVFSWYTLEEISQTWFKNLSENPALKTALAA
jgi:hypothetical protein